MNHVPDDTHHGSSCSRRQHSISCGACRNQGLRFVTRADENNLPGRSRGKIKARRSARPSGLQHASLRPLFVACHSHIGLVLEAATNGTASVTVLVAPSFSHPSCSHVEYVCYTSSAHLTESHEAPRACAYLTCAHQMPLAPSDTAMLPRANWPSLPCYLACTHAIEYTGLAAIFGLQLPMTRARQQH